MEPIYFGDEQDFEAEIPFDEGEGEGEGDGEGEEEEEEAQMTAVSENLSTEEELENVKKKLKEIEEETGNLRQKSALIEKEVGGAAQGHENSTGASDGQSEKEEADSRSIYVGNVDYECTPEEVQQHFQSCGTVNRVTILTDQFGQPKGFAYVEFVETEAVQNALMLNESELHGRPLKVMRKRTNVPGMKQHRGRPSFRRGFMPSSYSYGRVPRYRRPMRYSPY